MRKSRGLTRLTLVAIFICLCAVLQSVGQSTQTVQETPSSDMLRSYLQKIALGQLASRKQRIDEIRTRQQFEKRRIAVRRKLLAMMGGLPDRRSPLNVRIIGVIDHGDYRVEKIIFESLPKFYVTANLYVPQTGSSRYPAILQPTGHSLAAKVRAFYQEISLGLVKSGFVVLTYDPIGQGERVIYYDSALGSSKVGGTTEEHEMVGTQSLLANESLARYMVWDGMRGIDLLQSLSYVDPPRIGVTGCSGGGTLTEYIAALDDRVKVAAPACSISDWEHGLLGTGMGDAEQEFPDELKNGFDDADFVEAFAPKPYLIVSTTGDYVPIVGSHKTLEESKQIYALYGAEDKVSSFVGSGGHGERKPEREAVEAWMTRWLKGGTGEIVPEPPFQTEYEQNLLCTATGQVSTSLGGDTVSTLNMRRFSKLTPPRPALMRRTDVDRLRTRLQGQVVQLTGYQASTGPLNVKTLGSTERNGYRITHLSYEAAPGRIIPALLVTPDAKRSKKKSIVYVDQRGMYIAVSPKLEEVDGHVVAAQRGDVDSLAQLGYTVLVLDPSGIASTWGVNSSSWSHGPNSSWFGPDEAISWLALVVGRTMVGIRMEDILRGVDVLKEKGLLYGGKCIGFAKGAVGVDLLHAAVMDPRIASVAVEDGLVSYAAVARSPLHRDIFGTVIPGVLGAYDLPDLVAVLAPRPVWLVDLRSPVGNTVFLRDASQEYAYASSAYAAAGVPKQLRIGLRREGEDVASAYPALK